MDQAHSDIGCRCACPTEAVSLKGHQNFISVIQTDYQFNCRMLGTVVVVVTLASPADPGSHTNG